MSDLSAALAHAFAGMRAQGDRMAIIAENIAHADVTPSRPGETPYRRKVARFASTLDRELGVELVTSAAPAIDRSPFGEKRMPGHPAADENGVVLTPNVDSLVERVDMQAAQRHYRANLGVYAATRAMMSATLDILSP